MDTLAAVSELLRSPGATGIEHPGGTLDAHSPSTRQVHDRFTGEVAVLTDDEARNVPELSLVNELDVAEHAPGFLDRHGDFFRRLTADWAALLGPAVTAEAHRILGGR